MFYRDGRQARLGDRVRIGDTEGTIVFSIDTNEYAAGFAAQDWRPYLGRGVMVRFEAWGLIHYEEPEDDLEFVARAPGMPADG